jgi:hypothetical protein
MILPYAFDEPSREIINATELLSVFCQRTSMFIFYIFYFYLFKLHLRPVWVSSWLCRSILFNSCPCWKPQLTSKLFPSRKGSRVPLSQKTDFFFWGGGEWHTRTTWESSAEQARMLCMVIIRLGRSLIADLKAMSRTWIGDQNHFPNNAKSIPQSRNCPVAASCIPWNPWVYPFKNSTRIDCAWLPSYDRLGDNYVFKNASWKFTSQISKNTQPGH